jgi:hypothetical protein
VRRRRRRRPEHELKGGLEYTRGRGRACQRRVMPASCPPPSPRLAPRRPPAPSLPLAPRHMTQDTRLGVAADAASPPAPRGRVSAFPERGRQVARPDVACERAPLSRRRACFFLLPRLARSLGVTFIAHQRIAALDPLLCFLALSLSRARVPQTAPRSRDEQTRRMAASGASSAARAALPTLEALYRHLPSSVYKFNVRLERAQRRPGGAIGRHLSGKAARRPARGRNQGGRTRNPPRPPHRPM